MRPDGAYLRASLRRRHEGSASLEIAQERAAIIASALFEIAILFLLEPPYRAEECRSSPHGDLQQEL